MIFEAVKSLCPNAKFGVQNNDYEKIDWWSDDIQKPTEQEVNAEVARLQAEYDASEYQRKRAAEYPPITDYLDGVVKGDQTQIDKYIADCLAVKAKYPKG